MKLKTEKAKAPIFQVYERESLNRKEGCTVHPQIQEGGSWACHTTQKRDKKGEPMNKWLCTHQFRIPVIGV